MLANKETGEIVKKIRNLLMITLVTLSLLSAGVPALAAGTPSLPAAYYGSVSFSDGSAVPAGTVEAVINSTVCGSIGISNGKYGSPGAGNKLVVQGDSLVDGQSVVAFKVDLDGKKYTANQTTIWKSGDLVEQDLTLTATPKPAPTLAKLALSGSPSLTYSGTVFTFDLTQLTLGGTDQSGAAYVVDPAAVTWIVVSGLATVSGHILTITGSGPITVSAAIGGVTSNNLALTVQASPSGNTGGPSGGGGGPPPPTPPATTTATGLIPVSSLATTTNNGQTTARVPAAAVQAQLDAGRTAITVDLSSVTTPVSVSLPAAALDAAASKGASLTVASEWANLTIPAGTLPAGQEAMVTVQPAPEPAALPAGLQLVGQPVSIAVTTAGGKASFSKNVTLILAYDATKAASPDNLFVYRLNDDGTYTCVGGAVQNGKATVDLAHLSKYTVMQFKSGFADIDTHWAKRDILFMNARGILKGVSAATFQPDRPVTRAEFAALILRTLNMADASPATSVFSDVASGAWYYGAINAAYNAGLVNGVGGGRYDPDRTITRQEMAVLILNALTYAKAGVTVAPAEKGQLLAKFSDQGQLSAWAQDGVAACVKIGIIKGNPDGAFAPQAAATRAVSAVMTEQLLRAVKLI